MILNFIRTNFNYKIYLDSRARIRVVARPLEVGGSLRFVGEKVLDRGERFRSGQREDGGRTSTNPNRDSPNAKSSAQQSIPNLKLNRIF